MADGGNTVYDAAARADPPFDPAPDDAYLGPLDGVRGLAIVLVMAGHLELVGMNAARFGVTLFFFISGFLIARLLLDELRAAGTIRIGDFYRRRLIRLYPAMAVVVLVNAAILWVAGIPPDAAKLLSVLTYTVNHHIILSSDEPWNHLSRMLWSLCVEWHFYLVFPILLLVAVRRRWPLPAVVLALIGAVTLWRAGLHAHCAGAPESLLCGPRLDIRLYIGTDTRIDSILFGVVLTLLLAGGSGRRWLPALTHPAVVAVAAVLLVASAASTSPHVRMVHQYTVQGLALAPIVAALLFAPGWGPARRAAGSAVPAFIGRISYALYLCHGPAMGAAAKMGLAVGSPAWVGVVLLLSAAGSLGCHFGIERPLMAWRRRLRGRPCGLLLVPPSVAPMHADCARAGR